MNNKEFFLSLKKEIDFIEKNFNLDKLSNFRSFKSDDETILFLFGSLQKIIALSDSISIEELNLFPNLKKVLKSLLILEPQFIDIFGNIQISFLYDFYNIDFKILKQELNNISF